MKKSLFSLILLTFVLIATQVHAQTGFGIRGGVNFANLNDTDADFDTRTGFMAGAYFNFLVPNSPVSIQPEVLYTQKGYELSDDATIKLDYIEIPVLAKFDFITNGSITPNVYFGPYIGFNVNAELDLEGEVMPDFPDDGLNDTTEDTDFGVVVGGGLDFGRLDLGVRYGAGLTNTFEDEDGKNGVFSITAGIGF